MRYVVRGSKDGLLYFEVFLDEVADAAVLDEDAEEFEHYHGHVMLAAEDEVVSLEPDLLKHHAVESHVLELFHLQMVNEVVFELRLGLEVLRLCEEQVDVVVCGEGF